MVTTVPDFEALDQEQQVQRLELLGRNALGQFGVKPLEVTSLEHAENTTFKVVTSDGAYCLRIHRPGYQSFESIHSELEWLSAIRRDTQLAVPDPQISLRGELVVRASVVEVPEERNCVLFQWLEGEFLREPTPEQFRRLGRAMAQLHEHALHWNRPADFTRHFLDDTGMYNEDSDKALLTASELISDEDRELVKRIAEESRALMRQLGKGPEVYGLIHGDLHRGNFLFEGETIKLIDFDDCGFAHYLYDFAASLAYQLRFEDFEGTRDALFDGYESIRPLPPHTRECLSQFLRLRFHGIVKWVLDRGDNPKMRERGRDFISHLLEGIQQTYKL
ncbi:MAG: phosphotransferase enzyme family protein [Fimbriimonas sp.]